MNRIAEAECATCHLIRPKTEMREVRVRRKSGSSFGFWNSNLSSNTDYKSHRSGQSYRTSYAHREVWVCKGCKRPRSDWTPAHYAALFAFALFVWIFFVPTSERKSNASTQTGVTDTSALQIPAEQLAGANELEAPAPDNEPVEAPPLSSSQSPVEQIDFGVSEVLEAETKAASAGKPTRWKSDGHKGYAVPSEATIAPGTGAQCRNVYATADGLDQQSPVVRFCQSPSGDWTLSN
jgi:hypothetical protein